MRLFPQCILRTLYRLPWTRPPRREPSTGRVETETWDLQVEEEGKIWALSPEHPVLALDSCHFHISPLVGRALQLMADHSKKGGSSVSQPPIPVGLPSPPFPSLPLLPAELPSSHKYKIKHKHPQSRRRASDR